MKSNDDWMKSELIHMREKSNEQAGKTRERPAQRIATNGNREANFKHPFFLVSRQITHEVLT